MFVLSHALVKTGLLEAAAERLSNWLGSKRWMAVSILLLAVSLFSGLLNNTAIVAIFIPMVMTLCRRLHLSPSKVLIPLSYSAIVGGTLTLIGTSTNLLVSAMAEDAGEKPIGMFEVTRMGAVFTTIGLAYTLVFARKLLPSRSVISSLTRKYHMSPYLTELKIPKDSMLVGRTCREVGISRVYDVTVLAILRGGDRIILNIRDLPLLPADILIVRGTFDKILRLRNDHGVALLSDLKLTEQELSAGGQLIAEGLVSHASSFIGQTLKELDFRRHFGAFVLAIRRHGATLHSKIAHITMEFADTLLILAPPDRLGELRRSEDLIILSSETFESRRGRLWWLVMVLVPLIVGLAAFHVLDITNGALLAMISLLLLRVINPKEMYRAVDWSVIFLIAAFVPMGHAMVRTGAAQFLASGILSLSEFFPADLKPQVALSLLYLVTSLMTQMVSNNAAAIILVPVGLTMGADMGISARPFLLAICFAASTEFMTPTGYQTNAMVYGPGSYRFLDYTRFGAPLNLIFWIAGTFLIPRFWPF
jgi:di/tricarboxylate transporter